MYKTRLLAILAVLAAGIFSSVAVNAAFASVPGDFGSGWIAGKSAAYHALNTGHQYDASCPTSFINHKSYCTGYHSGYLEEWTALGGTRPPAGPATNFTMSTASNATTTTNPTD